MAYGQHSSPRHPLFAYCDTVLKIKNCKLDQIRSAWASRDRIGALRIAARFFDRSADTKTFKRGMDAHNNPDFYRQLGKEPEQITQDAIETLAKRFILN